MPNSPLPISEKLITFTTYFYLPVLLYDSNEEKLHKTEETLSIPIETSSLPLSASFAVFKPENVEDLSLLFVDPTANETSIADNNTVSIIGTSGGSFLSVETQSETGIAQELLTDAFEIAKDYFLKIKFES